MPEPTETSPRYLHTLFDDGGTTGLTDGQLLERFATRSGEAAEAAFEAIVERHGGLVLGACRGLLRDEHDARDTFQATFLTLLRKARTLWVADSIGPWLHRVACREAGKVRRRAETRRRRERAAVRVAESKGASESDRRDLAAAIHQEVDRLPGAFREAVVLCDLEGNGYEEAARRAGCSVGTIKSRLARGRRRLRGRLVRRGLAPAVGGSLAAGMASAAVPRVWADLAVREAMVSAMLRDVPFGSSPIIRLRGGLRAMRHHAIWGMGGLAAVGLVVGLALRAPGASGQQEAARPGGAVAPAAPKAAAAASPEEVARLRDRVATLRAEQEVAEIDRDVLKDMLRDVSTKRLQFRMRTRERQPKEGDAEARDRDDRSQKLIELTLAEMREGLISLSTEYNRRRLDLLDAEKALDKATAAPGR